VNDVPIIDAPLLDVLLSRSEPIALHDLARQTRRAIEALRAELDRLRAAEVVLRDEPLGVSVDAVGLAAGHDYLTWACPNPIERGGHGRIVEVYRQTTSTQDAVRRLIATYGRRSDGAIVVADEQSAGRGRLGRRWVCPPGLGLTFSRAVVRDRRDVTPDRLAFATSVAISEAIEQAAGAAVGDVRIKWPNDLYVDGQKIAGILVESSTESVGSEAVASAVIGVGINVDVTRDDLPNELADVATSVSMQGWRAHRLRILAEAVRAMDDALNVRDCARLVNMWRSRSMMLGQCVPVRCDGRDVVGTVEDLDPQRGLVLRGERGEMVFLPAETSTIVQSQ